MILEFFHLLGRRHSGVTNGLNFHFLFGIRAKKKNQESWVCVIQAVLHNISLHL